MGDNLSGSLVELYDYDHLEFTEPWLKEQVRLESFQPWFNSDVNKEKLAQAGFFYAQECDYVQCYYCCIVIGNWTRGDNPFIEHKIHSPQCNFINGNHAANIPLPGTENILKDGLELVKKTDLYDPTVSSLKTRIVKPSISSLRQSARHPEYADKQVRLESFINWPSGLNQVPQQLSEAGFFYLGVGDEVKCFYCGGCLRNFSPNDHALNEHKKYFFQRCRFIQLTYKNLRASSSKLVRIRPVKATGDQMQYLIAFMDENVDIRDGKPLQEREAYSIAWDTLALELNNLDGAYKDVKEWKEVWRNYKYYYVKRQSRKMEDSLNDLSGCTSTNTVESIDDLHLTEEINVSQSQTADTHSVTIQPFQHKSSDAPMTDELNILDNDIEQLKFQIEKFNLEIKKDQLNLRAKMDNMELVHKQIDLEQKWHNREQQMENLNDSSLQNELNVLGSEVEQLKLNVDKLNIEKEKCKLKLQLKSTKRDLI